MMYFFPNYLKMTAFSSEIGKIGIASPFVLRPVSFSIGFVMEILLILEPISVSYWVGESFCIWKYGNVLYAASSTENDTKFQKTIMK